MTPADGDWRRRAKRLSREPTVHFFILGALLFLLHHLIVGNPRTIVVSPGVKAAVTRRFQDHAGRAPTPAEADAALRDWKRDEALFREALREGLDRDDATIRNVLVDRMRARAALEAPKHEPSDAELEGWLASHRELYDVEGVHPRLSEVRPRVLADYTFAARERALARASQAVVDRYRFEERR